MPLNKVQEQIIDATLEFMVDATSCLAKDIAVRGLCAVSNKDAVFSVEIYGEAKEALEQLHQLLHHPHPQNRSTSYPYVGQRPGEIAYPVFDASGNFLRAEFEPMGLLSLTGRTVPGEPHPNAEEVRAYIQRTLESKISALSSEKIAAGLRNAEIGGRLLSGFSLPLDIATIPAIQEAMTVFSEQPPQDQKSIAELVCTRAGVMIPNLEICTYLQKIISAYTEYDNEVREHAARLQQLHTEERTLLAQLRQLRTDASIHLHTAPERADIEWKNLLLKTTFTEEGAAAKKLTPKLEALVSQAREVSQFLSTVQLNIRRLGVVSMAGKELVDRLTKQFVLWKNTREMYDFLEKKQVDSCAAMITKKHVDATMIFNKKSIISMLFSENRLDLIAGLYLQCPEEKVKDFFAGQERNLTFATRLLPMHCFLEIRHFYDDQGSKKIAPAVKSAQFRSHRYEATVRRALPSFLSVAIKGTILLELQKLETAEQFTSLKIRYKTLLLSPEFSDAMTVHMSTLERLYRFSRSRFSRVEVAHAYSLVQEDTQFELLLAVERLEVKRKVDALLATVTSNPAIESSLQQQAEWLGEKDYFDSQIRLLRQAEEEAQEQRKRIEAAAARAVARAPAESVVADSTPSSVEVVVERSESVVRSEVFSVATAIVPLASVSRFELPTIPDNYVDFNIDFIRTHRATIGDDRIVEMLKRGMINYFERHRVLLEGEREISGDRDCLIFSNHKLAKMAGLMALNTALAIPTVSTLEGVSRCLSNAITEHPHLPMGRHSRCRELIDHFQRLITNESSKNKLHDYD